MKAFIRSFYYAANGLRICFLSEINFRVHVLAALAITVLSIVLGISPKEWLAVMFCVALVIMAELLNTSLEKLSDLVSPGYHETIRKVKDMAAAAVLIAAILSLVCGLIIFMPYLF